MIKPARYLSLIEILIGLELLINLIDLKFIYSQIEFFF